MKKLRISDLVQDQRNNNKHTSQGMDLLESSMRKVGIIESITVSSDNKIISGNARHEKAGAVFDSEPLVIDTDGKRPIILRRTDIKSETKQFYEASILANTTAKKNIDFDTDVIEELSVDFDLDIGELGYESVGSAEWKEDTEKDHFSDEGIEAKSQYGVIVMCDDEAAQEKVFGFLSEDGYKCKIVVV
jgi:hypothetical protein